MTYRQAKQALLANFGQLTTRKLLRDLAKLTDQTLSNIWAQSGLAAYQQFCLVAVGGYGRGELFPYSDVDVLVLLPNAADPQASRELQSCIESFVGLCWDAGLEIGSSVRRLSECIAEAAKDITIQTALLEVRCITPCKAGSMEAKLYNDFKDAYTAALDVKAFATAKTLEMAQRYNKFENTPYALEPNCKESPGGLRDLHIILWLAKAANLGTTWDELAANGLATPFEAKQLKRNEAILATIRTQLHLVAKRREDRLVFDLQTQVALAMGYAHESSRKNSEALMHDYYWAAKAVVQLNQILLLNIDARLSPNNVQPIQLTDDFFDRNGLLDIASDDLYQRKSQAILQTFYVFQKTAGVNGLSARTLRALYNARGLMNASFRRDPVNRATFLAIMQTGEGLTHTMRLLNQTSVLGRYLWVFRRIVGQMQHDLFHVYTVDQHILMVLRNVRRFFIADHAHEYPFCSQLAGDWDKPWILYIAALFHDIAKGRGGDHSELGIAEAHLFCKQHRVPVDDANLIAFLVKEHLTMSQIAQKQDLSDPDVIAAFAKRVGSQRHLTALYLLTVADIRGTSPKVWNAWKAKLLEDLYRYTARSLGGRAPDAASLVETTRRKACEALALYDLPAASAEPLWKTLGVSYFMRQAASDVAWHTRLLMPHVGSALPIVRARLSPIGEGLQVLIYTPDTLDLFARICGYFERHNFSIWDAKIHTTNDGHALDSFLVTAVGLDADQNNRLLKQMESHLTHDLTQLAPLGSVPKVRQSRRVKSFPIQPHVELHPDEKGQRWILSLVASDRVGLLYAIARVLAAHEVNLQLAKITTLGERVEDSFVVNGAVFQNAKGILQLETDLLAALQYE
ncbi:MAG: [protein-PII] uridylyltransferase [Cytophagales bacterium]|nr:[protein-PII] uridylyltransferase [Cytophagales bacterium]